MLLPWLLRAGLPYGLDEWSRPGPFLNGKVPDRRPAVSSQWSAIPAFPNLTFTNPLGLIFLPGTTKLAVWEREGAAWVFENDKFTTNRTKMLDVSDRCQGWGGGGFLGLAFHPNFATNHFVYIYYTWVAPGTATGSAVAVPVDYRDGEFRDRLSRFTLDDDYTALPGSELVLVDQVTSSLWHDGGGLFFNPDDGFLYWSDGDDAYGLSQTVSQNLLSGVFRIDVDQRGGTVSHPIRQQPAQGVTANYYIPNDNPFVGQSGVLEEFYALGLRSPHRMTYDPPSKRIFIGDVGDNTWEEIDVIEPTDPPGINFQWIAAEGTSGELLPPYIGTSKGPTLEYGHDEGNSIIGGYVYRGSEFAAELGGRYIFADFGWRTVWALDESAEPIVKVPLFSFANWHAINPLVDSDSISSFGIDAGGELYICQLGNFGGGIYRLSHTNQAEVFTPFPSRLSETGAFTNTPALEASAGLLPYAVNSPLWSDGAAKSRWAALPAGQTISVNTNGDWTFPIGTVFVKHFELATDETKPDAPKRRLETRLMVLGTNGAFFGATYKWRADNSDADLLTNKLDESILVATSSGVRTQVWHYPSPDECLRCHNGGVGGALGVSARQLNGPLAYTSGVVDNQLRTWNHLGLFSPGLDESAIDSMEKLVSISDSSADLEARVRSYLDANCSFCHHPGGAPASWDGRIQTKLNLAGIINGSVSQSLGLTAAKIVAPGHPERSILMVRAMSTNETIKMPPLGRNVVDNSAMTVVDQWIRSLAGSNEMIAPPWFSEDIGNASPSGFAVLNNDVLKIDAGGPNVWYAYDQFHFTYQPFSGNGELSARLNSVLDVGQIWTRAGIMVRESTSPGARHVFLFVNTEGWPGVMYRNVAYDQSILNFWYPIELPSWLKLSRLGDSITAYMSSDGTNWQQAFETVLPRLSSDAFIGFAVASSTILSSTEAVFDQVEAGGSVDPLNHLPTINLLEPMDQSVLFLPGSITISASASDADGPVDRVEFYDGIEKIGSVENPPFSFIWTNPPIGTHQISARVVDSGGAIAATTSVAVTVAAVTLDTPILDQNNQGVRISFSGLNGVNYVLERSLDLVNWTPFSTNILSNGQIQVMDVGVSKARSAFYRVQVAR